MSHRRHNIIGSEVGRPRPIVYLRPSPKRSRLRRRKPTPWPLLAATAAALVLAGLVVAGALSTA